MLTDVRDHEDLFALDKDGFEWIQSPSQVDVLDPNFDVLAYLKQTTDFLHQWCQCQEVLIYDYVRRSPNKLDKQSGFSDVTRRVHCGRMAFFCLRVSFFNACLILSKIINSDSIYQASCPASLFVVIHLSARQKSRSKLTTSRPDSMFGNSTNQAPHG